MLPATVLYVYIGSLAKNVASLTSGDLDTGLGRARAARRRPHRHGRVDRADHAASDARVAGPTRGRRRRDPGARWGMTARVAVVIPVLGDEAELARLLPLLRLQQTRRDHRRVRARATRARLRCAASTRARISRRRPTAASNSTWARRARRRAGALVPARGRRTAGRRAGCDRCRASKRRRERLLSVRVPGPGDLVQAACSRC